MNDHHMHYPADFNPNAPRKAGESGMVCAPGTRVACSLCTPDGADTQVAAPRRKVGRPPKDGLDVQPT